MLLVFHRDLQTLSDLAEYHINFLITMAKYRKIVEKFEN